MMNMEIIGTPIENHVRNWYGICNLELTNYAITVWLNVGVDYQDMWILGRYDPRKDFYVVLFDIEQPLEMEGNRVVNKLQAA